MCQADETLKTEDLEGVADQGARALGRVAVSPSFGQQPIPELDLDSLRYIFEAEPADELAALALGGRPDTESRIVAVIACRPRQRRGDRRPRSHRAIADV